MGKKSSRGSSQLVGSRGKPNTKAADPGTALRQGCMDAAGGNEPLVFVDGHDDAILGIAERNGDVFVVYDQSKIIRLLCKRDGMDKEGAAEFFEYNIAGAYLGPSSPTFLIRCRSGR